MRTQAVFGKHNHSVADIQRYTAIIGEEDQLYKVLRTFAGQSKDLASSVAPVLKSMLSYPMRTPRPWVYA